MLMNDLFKRFVSKIHFAVVVLLVLATVAARAQEDRPPPPEQMQDTSITDTDIRVTENSYFYKKWDTLTVKERNVPASEQKRLQSDKDFWYANKDFNPDKKTASDIRAQKEKGKKVQQQENGQEEQQSNEPAYEPISQRSWFQSLLWVVIVGVFVVVLLIYLGNNNIGLFRKKNFVRESATTDEPISEDIFAINYQKEIEKAAAQGNFRLATRLMFLRLLRTLSDKNIIRYQQDKTNMDYLAEVHNKPFYRDFFRITRNYEYTWYGLFPLTGEEYQLIRTDFDRLEKELR